jgi:hypothetical protein
MISRRTAKHRGCPEEAPPSARPSVQMLKENTRSSLMIFLLGNDFIFAGRNFLKKVFPRAPLQKLLNE